MLTRRIVIGVCALCFAIPAVAEASPATVPPNAKGLYGPATGPPNTVKAKGLYGPAATGPPNTVKAKGLYGPAATGPPNTVKAKGLYGPAATDSDDISGVTARAAGASGRDGTNDWRTAAISEAALLAAPRTRVGAAAPRSPSRPPSGDVGALADGRGPASITAAFMRTLNERYPFFQSGRSFQLHATAPLAAIRVRSRVRSERVHRLRPPRIRSIEQRNGQVLHLCQAAR